VPTAARVSTNLYSVLGVDASAGGDEIARAFRARAKQFHPDTSNDPDTVVRFNELVAAYEVLSNHRTRREYDRTSSARDLRSGALSGRDRGNTTTVAADASAAPASPRWTRGRAWTALVAGALVTVLGVGAAVLTWELHEHDAQRHARFRPVTAVRAGNGDITFTTPNGHFVRTREPQQHGEGSDLGPTVEVRYDPANPTHVIVDANTLGRDITLAIVSLKLMIGGPVFVVLGARRLRQYRPRVAR
jgi:curved DNA-binding protein CbpA